MLWWFSAREESSNSATTAQTGFSTTYQKVTQYNSNGIEEGGVVVDLPNDEIDLPAGTWEFSFSHSFTAANSNIIVHFAIFDVADTGFITPLLQRERKIGTGSDIGSMGGSKYITLASPATIAMFGKVDSGTSALTMKHGTLSVIRIK